jgi:uncharacterized protein YqcC (DUF446 family)
MKRIFLFIAVSLVFLAAGAQITQSASDSIALQRMSKETRQYTLFAQKNVQTTFTITTSKGEVLELDYLCWVYYVCYLEETDNNNSLYLIVKESDGNLLEVKTKNAIPDDLAEWRALKWITIPFMEYLLDSASCQWTNVVTDTVIIINSNEELENHITCMAGNYLPIDFDQYSLLLVHGNTVYGSIADLIPSLSMLSPDNYKLTVEIQVGDTAAAQQWYTAIIVPKMEQNAVYLNVYYPHISVWRCFFESSMYRPDVIIMLTMDTLLGKYHTNTFPQDLNKLHHSMAFLFFDDVDGKYLIEEDTIHFYYPDGSINKFTRTMFSPVSMLLHRDKSSSPPEVFIVRDYLFIKQNYNY